MRFYVPVGISRIKEKILKKELREKISDFRPIVPAVNQHVRVEGGVGEGGESNATTCICFTSFFKNILYINFFEDHYIQKM
jgi:hypothetical protein